jgi:pyrroloquinoline quinone biosynthesis protein B
MVRMILGGGIVRIALVALLCLFASAARPGANANEAPYLYVLGVAQDAGYPQAGCYAAHCLPGWKDASLRRMPVSLGLVDPSASQKYLFEATPSLPEQLYVLEQEAPSARFELAGIFLTHAHIGHYAGLMFLGHEAMGASGVPVFAMPRMREYLGSNGPWSQLVSYGNIVLKPLTEGVAQSIGSVRVTAFRVPHREEYSEAVGYRIEGPTRSALFIPDIDKWSRWDKALPELVAGVDYALIDATFYADGELPGRDMSKVAHPFVEESMALLEHLPEHERRKVYFIHMNHTNPLLRPDSEESARVRGKGFNIATEGLRLTL